jgi:hypothetical protein
MAKIWTKHRPLDPDVDAGLKSKKEIFVGANVGMNVGAVLLPMVVGTLLSVMVGSDESLTALGSMEGGVVVVVGAPLWTIVGAKEVVGAGLVEGEMEEALVVVDGLMIKLLGPKEVVPIVDGVKEEEGRLVMVGTGVGKVEIVGSGLALRDGSGSTLSATFGAMEKVGIRDGVGKSEPGDNGALVGVSKMLRNGMFPIKTGAVVPVCVGTGAVVTGNCVVASGATLGAQVPNPGVAVVAAAGAKDAGSGAGAAEAGSGVMGADMTGAKVAASKTSTE